MATRLHSCFTVRCAQVVAGIKIDLCEEALVLGTDAGDMARQVFIHCSTANPPMLEQEVGSAGEVLDESECMLHAASLEVTDLGYKFGGAEGDSQVTRSILVFIDTAAVPGTPLLQDGHFRRDKGLRYLAIGHGTSSSDQNPRCEWQHVLFLMNEGDAISVRFAGVEGEWMLSNASGSPRLRKKRDKEVSVIAPQAKSPRAAADEAFARLTRASSSNGSAPTEAVE